MTFNEKFALIRHEQSVEEQLATFALFDNITNAEIESLIDGYKSGEVGLLLEYLGPVRLRKYLPQFLEFLQDFNWPGAGGAARMLSAAGEMIVPEIRRVLREVNDAQWNYWIIWSVIWNWEDELIIKLKPDLLYIMQKPDREGAAIMAFDLLKGFLASEERSTLYQQLRGAFQTMQSIGQSESSWFRERASLLADLEAALKGAP